MTKTTKGYSLLELILVMAILAVVAGAGAVFLFGQKTSTELEEEAKRIEGNLRSSQSKAMTLEQGASWGVHFNNVVSSSAFYDIFWGLSYAVGTTTDRLYLPESILFEQPTSTASTTIIFAKRTGEPVGGGSTTITLITANQNQRKSIIIWPKGRITAD